MDARLFPSADPALSDVALVVSSDRNKGGAWAGAVEQLEKLGLVPVYVRSHGSKSEGLEALREKGALAWPEPSDPEALETVLNGSKPTQTGSVPAVATRAQDGRITLFD